MGVGARGREVSTQLREEPVSNMAALPAKMRETESQTERGTKSRQRWGADAQRSHNSSRVWLPFRKLWVAGRVMQER